MKPWFHDFWFGSCIGRQGKRTFTRKNYPSLAETLQRRVVWRPRTARHQPFSTRELCRTPEIKFSVTANPLSSLSAKTAKNPSKPHCTAPQAVAPQDKSCKLPHFVDTKWSEDLLEQQPVVFITPVSLGKAKPRMNAKCLLTIFTERKSTFKPPIT